MHDGTTRGIKYWGLSGMPSASLAGKFLSVDRFAALQSPTFHTANVGQHSPHQSNR